jgi:hypothetical protein
LILLQQMAILSVSSLALIGNVAAQGCGDEAVVLMAGTFSISE